jgi:lipooligosaccharide transport system permease protein
VFPLFLFSGAFFPVANLGDVGAFVARLTPLWHGVNLSRMFCVTPSFEGVDWSMAALNVSYLLVLLLLGWRWSVTGLAKRLIT